MGSSEGWMPESSPAPMAQPLGKLCFSDDGKNKLRKHFKNITCFADPTNGTSGGVNEAGCSITPLDGPLFHTVIYHGDIYGWRKDIENRCQRPRVSAGSNRRRSVYHYRWPLDFSVRVQNRVLLTLL